jgi:hypothetical protein
MKLYSPHPNRFLHFRFSFSFVFMRHVFLNFEIPKPEIPKQWIPYLVAFRIWGLLYVVFGYLKPRNPEAQIPEIPKCGTHSPSFAFQKIVSVGCLAFEVTGFRNPKSRSTKASLFCLLEIGLCRCC